MKLGFSGADSVGKSTLIRAIQQKLQQRNLRVSVLSIGDVARGSPFPVLENQTLAASCWILNAIAELEHGAALSCDVVLSDRTALDVWVFQRLSAVQLYSLDAERFQQDVARALSEYQAIFCARIDQAQPVKWENLTDVTLQLRSQFDDKLADGMHFFQRDALIIELPHALAARIARVDEAIRAAMSL